ncbi:MAG TPA: CDP-alcohol phosphatidyltransferase family protein [Bacteroidota bacterium]|jgi:phosphatidylglycerophosphate synthase
MARPGAFTLYRRTLKSDEFYADELINIFLLRPLAALVVWLVYPLRVTPNDVTIAAIAVGFASAYDYWLGTSGAIALAGVLIVLKDILDDADGQLARAKELYSRRGRFLDSVGDFAVNLALFAGITSAVHRVHPNGLTLLLGALSLLGITLRVSYHVFYQVSFLHRENRYKLNRISEEITDEDRTGDPVALRLQRAFVLIYGWQDRLMAGIDRWSMGERFDETHTDLWYSDRFGLRLSGLMGFGTEYILLAAFSWWNMLDAYLLFNVFILNGVWLSSVLYRRIVLAKNLAQELSS